MDKHLVKLFREPPSGHHGFPSREVFEYLRYSLYKLTEIKFHEKNLVGNLFGISVKYFFEISLIYFGHQVQRDGVAGKP